MLHTVENDKLSYIYIYNIYYVLSLVPWHDTRPELNVVAIAAKRIFCALCDTSMKFDMKLLDGVTKIISDIVANG